jgi:hypothetical protein
MLRHCFDECIQSVGNWNAEIKDGLLRRLYKREELIDTIVGLVKPLENVV